MALTTNLVSYWKLDESSGNAADSVGSNTLTNNNTTPFVAAKINNGADMENSSAQSFSITDASQTGLDITGDMSISLWVNLESAPSGDVMYFVTKYKAGGNNSYAFDYQDSAGTKNLLFANSFNGTADVAVTVAQTLTLGSWFHLVAVYTAAAGSCQFYVNGSSLGTPTGLGTSIFNGTADFSLGGQDGGSSVKFDGIMDEVGVWSRTLTSGEVTTLYNGGAGISYPFVTAADMPYQARLVKPTQFYTPAKVTVSK